jgi:hypothetical protein
MPVPPLIAPLLPVLAVSGRNRHGLRVLLINAFQA